ncbi:MAG: TIGR04283 family arsenosugar biosynthesis glycosyltransferase [Parvularculaceae bacterium]|nr:TIGR04283 family arsenosugar biosynthesis glycosyltransferase [Parvularculaceae bacterium]
MHERAPVSVIIPTLNAAGRLPSTLAPLAAASIGGLIREVVISDGGSGDNVEAVADAAGAVFLRGEKGRGGQLARGADAARGRWLLFLHADTILSDGWDDEVRRFIERGDEQAGVFTLKFDDSGLAPALVALGAMIRTRLFSAPYGDQGLVISRALYDQVGAFADMPIFEDVEFVNRLVRLKGRGALAVLKSRAVTSPDRYRRDGYLRRVLKNARCTYMYRMGVPPEKILASYE